MGMDSRQVLMALERAHGGRVTAPQGLAGRRSPRYVMDTRTPSPDRTFSRSELATYNGRDGRPTYVAYKGKVYDVSTSAMWPEGEHQFAHAAGDDLTGDMDFAPHGEEVLERFPVVGALRD